ncbi:hypothetical protein niasHT_014626 [Heterodera trifolii]|uniref:Uncharacterized protein n=1 Tax=Heterodera trifolii TaxID=157864 RepID=A0ABD2LHX9_9BILA
MVVLRFCAVVHPRISIQCPLVDVPLTGPDSGRNNGLLRPPPQLLPSLTNPAQFLTKPSKLPMPFRDNKNNSKELLRI